MEMKDSANKKVTPAQGIGLLAVVAGFIVYCAKIGANTNAVMGLTWIIIWGFCVIFKYDWNKTMNAGFDAVRRSLGPLILLVTVGMLIGAWIAAGTIPTLIAYGLSIINPKVFLTCTLILTSLMSIFTGTSYGSAASAGIAMMGIGLSMGVPAGMTAGAILCGAILGDKISPLSDTTNICPALCGGTLIKHIQSQMYTTLPAYLICLVVFTILGLQYGSGSAFDPVVVQETIDACQANFVISPICLLPLVIIIVLLLAKVDVIPASLIGGVSGSVLAVAVQGETISATIGYMANGFSLQSGNEIVDKLVNRGGLSSMASVVCMGMFAIGMGNMLEDLGVMDVFMNILTKKVKTIFSLITSTMLVSYFASAMTCTMTSANVLTGKLMSPLFWKKGIAPEVCSRTMEDTATIGGVLMPWHANVIYYSGVLGVAYSQFVPFCILSYIVPVFSLICAATGFGIFYVNQKGERISKEAWKQLYNEN